MKAATLLYPSDYFDRTTVDEALKDEYKAASSTDSIETALFDINKFEESGELHITGANLDDCVSLIYRGWMMKPDAYRAFYEALVAKGFSPITTPEEYERMHMFPNAYASSELIRSSSPITYAIHGTEPDATEVNALFDSRFLMKDFVKSVKGTSFPKCFETPISQEDLDAAVSEFLGLRGDLFTEGIVLKEFRDLKGYDGITNEWRAFYLDGKLLSLDRNSLQPESCPAPPRDMAESFSSLQGRYYTVDFAEDKDGNWFVVETGDGQVSGLAESANPQAYFKALATALS